MKRKKRRMPKKVRAWYTTYRDRCQERKELPLPFRVWAAIEVDKFDPASARAKALKQAIR